MSLGPGCFRPRGKANELRRANERRDKSPPGKFPVSSCSAMGAGDPEIKAGRASHEEEGRDSANHPDGPTDGQHCIPHTGVFF